MQATLSQRSYALARDDSIWLRNAFYDLLLFAFPWIPFLLVVIYGLEWREDFSFARNPYTFKYLVLFLFSLNFAHRNYTYLVTYGDRNMFLTRKQLFTTVPLVVFTTVLAVYYFRHPWFIWVLVSVLAAWNIWHNIMQRHGLFRGYAAKLKNGLESRRHARLDLALLWTMVLFTMAIGSILHLSTAKRYRIARSSVNLLAPFFESYPIPIAAFFGSALLVLLLIWMREEWKHPIPFIKRVPRLSYLLSNMSIFALCIINPILGIFCFGFSHSVEYFAYVHAVQNNKVRKQQYRGAVGNFLWSHMLIGAALIIGLQVFCYYHFLPLIAKRLVLVKTFLTGTAAIHFFYDGIIWKKSRPVNKWTL